MIRDLPDWAKDRLHSTVDFHFDLKDRIKILFGWRLSIRVETNCQYIPGKVESETSLTLSHPFPRRRSNLCYEAIASPPPADNQDGDL